jgi:hypothetical protein
MVQPQLSVDAIIFTYWDSVGAVIYSDDANPTFFPVSGGQLCATSSQTGTQWCGYETVAAHLTANSDTLSIDCPNSIPAPPDMSLYTSTATLARVLALRPVPTLLTRSVANRAISVSARDMRTTAARTTTSTCSTRYCRLVQGCESGRPILRGLIGGSPCKMQPLERPVRRNMISIKGTGWKLMCPRTKKLVVRVLSF